MVEFAVIGILFAVFVVLSVVIFAASAHHRKKYPRRIYFNMEPPASDMEPPASDRD